jgi:hypothetical protein
MKRLVCWLLGHRWKTRPFREIQEEVGHGQNVRLYVCARCGAWEP